VSLNPFGGLGRGMVGGFVSRALGLGSQHPVIRGIVAFGMVVALGMFIVREYYDIQAARGNATSAQVQADTASGKIYRASFGPSKDYLLRAVDGGACNYALERLPADTPKIMYPPGTDRDSVHCVTGNYALE
jgi:hypothetical protein